MSATEANGALTAADLAAPALLGALLWDPDRIHDVADWLQPTDFDLPSYRAIYQTLIGLGLDGRPVDLFALPTILLRGEYHDMHVDREGHDGISANALHTLLARTPATPRADEGRYEGPVHSEHVRYARILVQAAVRRDLRWAGSRITQCAHDLREHTLADAHRALHPLLGEIAARINALAARLGDAGAATRSAAEQVLATPALAAQPVPASTAEPLDPQARWAEARLIGACLDSVQVRAAAADLRPTDFTDPAAAATWSAISDLVERGEPVDYILVAAHLEHHAGEGRGFSPADLARLAATSGGVAGMRWINVVAHNALTRAVATAGQALQALARGPATPTALSVDAATIVGRAARVVRRLAGPAADAGPSSAAATSKRASSPITAALESPPRTGRPAPPQPTGVGRSHGSR